MGKIIPLNFNEVNFYKIGEAILNTNSHNLEIANFRFTHCVRVCEIAKKLANGRLDEKKIEAMCYLHDAFKYVDSATHGSLAAKFLQTIYIEPMIKRSFNIKSAQYKKEMSEWRMVFEALKIHSNKTGNVHIRKRNLYASILIDADILDKLSYEYCTLKQKIFDPGKTISDIAHSHMTTVDHYNGTTSTFNSIKIAMLGELIDKCFRDGYKLEV